MSFLCGGGPSASTETGEWPDTGLVEPCCESSAYDGPGSCTCWEPVYDLDQQPIDEAKARLLAAGVRANTRKLMCGDCAYRPDSPEKTGDETYQGGADYLDALAIQDAPFWCHQGMRIPVRWRHPKTGMEIPGHPGAYKPPRRGLVPFKADGSPAELCAGWDARRRALGGEPR